MRRKLNQSFREIGEIRQINDWCCKERMPSFLVSSKFFADKDTHLNVRPSQKY